MISGNPLVSQYGFQNINIKVKGYNIRGSKSAILIFIFLLNSDNCKKKEFTPLGSNDRRFRNIQDFLNLIAYA